MVYSSTINASYFKTIIIIALIYCFRYLYLHIKKIMTRGFSNFQKIERNPYSCNKQDAVDREGKISLVSVAPSEVVFLNNIFEMLACLRLCLHA